MTPVHDMTWDKVLNETEQIAWYQSSLRHIMPKDREREHDIHPMSYHTNLRITPNWRRPYQENSQPHVPNNLVPQRRLCRPPLTAHRIIGSLKRILEHDTESLSQEKPHCARIVHGYCLTVIGTYVKESGQKEREEDVRVARWDRAFGEV